ncbi:MAG: CHASE2 domain-containing serine/threonine-protein kinase [Acidiferrobacterales bacterium]
MGKTTFWKKDWFIGLAVVLVFALVAGVGVLGRLEWGVYDLGVRYSLARPANNHVVVIAIDDTSLAKLGPWPWSRDLFAGVNRQLAAARASSIGYTLAFDAPQNEQALSVLRELRKTQGKKLGKTANTLLRRAQGKLDTDRILAASFKKARHVILSAGYDASGTPPKSTGALPKVLRKYRINKVNGEPGPTIPYLPVFTNRNRPLFADRLRAPTPGIAHTAAGIGLGMAHREADGVARVAPLVLSYGDTYLPSFPLLVAAEGLGVRARNIRIELGRGVRLGTTTIPTDRRLRAYPFFYKTRKDQTPFRVFAFHEVHSRKIPTRTFRDKIVLVGPTAPRLVQPLATPVGEPMAPVMLMAHTVSSLLNGDLYRAQTLSYWGRLFGFTVVAFYLMFILPGLRVSTGLALSGLTLAVLVVVQFSLMAVEAIWIPLMVPAAALVCGHVVLAGKRLAQDKADQFQQALAESNRMLGLSFQSQGQLDMAFDRFRKCLVDKSLMELLYNLALDFERKRQYNKARNVYQYLAGHDRRFRDVQDRLARSQAIEETGVLSISGGIGASGSLIVDAEGVQKPMLGRYELQRELAKGGMGVVYLGKDPKLSRVLAIKTLALSQEFEGERLQQVKERFFREAKTAAQLNHPHIVTIYDVGDEQDLAYIAMDYTEGEDLSLYCGPESLLPLDEVLNIMIQVAEALDYAHDQRIVHRDIKPANIIYNREQYIAKVTDFGVACLIDARTTKTGIVMGTPSYMSPEQLANKKLDGRSDLFSLGVTLYELVTGQLPFDDDSLSALVNKIANKKQRDVRKVRPELPQCVAEIVNKALRKEPGKRFQSGAELAKAVQGCVEKL